MIAWNCLMIEISYFVSIKEPSYNICFTNEMFIVLLLVYNYFAVMSYLYVFIPLLVVDWDWYIGRIMWENCFILRLLLIFFLFINYFK